MRFFSVTQEPSYVCIHFEMPDGASILLRLGPSQFPGHYPDHDWYAEVSSVKRDYLICQHFHSRELAAAHAVRLYNDMVVNDESMSKLRE